MKEMMVEQHLLPQVAHEQVRVKLKGPEQVGRWRMYEEYKNSGVAWMGKIPSHWEVKRLKYTVLGCQNGMWGNEPTSDDKDIFCVRVADFDRLNHKVNTNNLTIRSIPLSQRQGRTLRHGDLLIEKSGGGDLQPVGTVVLYDLEIHAVCSNFIARMPVEHNQYGSFLCYLFHFLYEARINKASIKQNTGIQNLDSADYLNNKLGLPIFQEQVIIAAFLDREITRINALIAKKERHIAFLQERRTAIINQAVTKGLNASVTMKDSGVEWLGEIPEKWEVRRVKHSIYSIKQGWSPSCENRLADADEWGVLKVGCVNGTAFNENENKALPKDLEPVPELEIKPGDILMSRANTRELLGSAAIVRDVRPRLLLCDKLYRLRIKQEILLPDFFVLIMRSSTVRFQLERDATGASSSMQNISQFTIVNVLLPVPDIKEQQSIVAYIEQETTKIDRLITRIQESIKKLKEYSTALVSAAVTGQIDVRREVMARSTVDVTV